MPIITEGTASGPQPFGLFTEIAGLRYRAGIVGEDAYGNDVYGDPIVEPTPAWWEPRESGESVVAQEQMTSGYWLYLPESTPLTGVDAVELPAGGDVYEVVGEPGRQPGGFIVDGYVKTAVKRVTG